MNPSDVNPAAADAFLRHAAGLPRVAPTVVVLCGSTKHRHAFEHAAMEESLRGNIVITVGMFGHDDYPPGAKARTSDGDESTAVKQMLDRLHFAKIDLADEILVIDVPFWPVAKAPRSERERLLDSWGTYTGSSTMREIAYATNSDKHVRWLSHELRGGIYDPALTPE